MDPISMLLISRRILQTTDIDAFTAIPEASLSPNSAAAAVRRPFNPTTPFDSSMALTILVLLTALFFLGFFSVYIRRFAGAAMDAAAPPHHRPPSKGGAGLDASAVDSLPLVSYGRTSKHPMIDDCPICLSEFHEKETVKLIPYCGHVFHPGCLDTWLASHVTCPLCRSTELFKKEVCLDVAPDTNDIPAPEIAERSTAQNGDTWSHERVRRSCSCTSLPNRAMLQRSTSF